MGETGFNAAWFEEARRQSPEGQKDGQKRRIADSVGGTSGNNPAYNPNARGLTVMTKGLGGIQDQRQRALAAPTGGAKSSTVGGGAPAAPAGKTALGG